MDDIVGINGTYRQLVVDSKLFMTDPVGQSWPQHSVQQYWLFLLYLAERFAV